MTIWTLIIYFAIIAIGAAICWEIYQLQREKDPRWRIHKRQMEALRRHQRAMKLWKKRGETIKPRKEWIA